jgi:hypothetical protein
MTSILRLEPDSYMRTTEPRTTILTFTPLLPPAAIPFPSPFGRVRKGRKEPDLQQVQSDSSAGL